MKNAYNNEIGPRRRKKQIKVNKPLLLIFTISLVIICLQIATQLFAKYLNYHPALGEPLYQNYYNPFKIIEWYKFNAQVEELYKMATFIPLYGIFLPVVIFFIAYYLIKGSKLKGNAYLHGSARWANREDIEDAGLLPYRFSAWQKFKYKIQAILSKITCSFIKMPPTEKKPEGVFVGAWENPKTGETHYLRHNGPEHILCVAPTRSGKGVGLVNPTLLSWTESCFITDLKGELWALTAGWRSKEAKNKCIRFEPALKRELVDKDKNLYNCARWNPLDEIRAEGSKEFYYDYKSKSIKTRICSGENEIADVQNICTLIVDPDGKGLEDHWAKTAFALLVGAVIHLKHNLPEHCNLQTLDLMLAGQINFDIVRKNPNMSLEEILSQNDSEESGGMKNLWSDMKLGLDRAGKEYAARKAVQTAGSDMFDRPDEEAGSVLSTAKSFLSLYRDPIVAENTSQSDFKIKQLMNMENPVSLYVVTQPADKGRLKPLVRLLVNLVIRLLADKMEFEGGRSVKGYAHKLLLMLDEFPSLGKLDIMQESLAFIAGYGMKAYLITQDMAQLFNAYGKDESISSNCHVSNWYAPLKAETGEIMSKRIGTTTILEENISISGTGFKASKSRSMQATGRALLTCDECMSLPGAVKDHTGNITQAGDMIILVAGYPAIYGKQPLYFKNSILLKRAQINAPIYSASLLKKDELRAKVLGAKADKKIKQTKIIKKPQQEDPDD